MPSPPPEDGAVVVAVEPGTSCWGAVVVGAAVVEVVDVAFVVVVVVDFAFVVVVVDLGFVVVVVGFLVVVVTLLVVVDSEVGGVRAARARRRVGLQDAGRIVSGGLGRARQHPGDAQRHHHRSGRDRHGSAADRPLRYPFQTSAHRSRFASVEDRLPLAGSPAPYR